MLKIVVKLKYVKVGLELRMRPEMGKINRKRIVSSAGNKEGYQMSDCLRLNFAHKVLSSLRMIQLILLSKYPELIFLKKPGKA